MKCRWLAPMGCMLLLSGCFHQVVQTGRAPSPTVVDKPFVATWLWGLVAANEIDIRKECPTGVAVVETEQSFVNGLVGVVTLGIFVPQHVRITCAMGTASLPPGASVLRLAANATTEESELMTTRAVEMARSTNAPVVIQMETTLHGDQQ
jgi:hypothetical protein